MTGRRYKTFIPINYRIESDFQTISAPRVMNEPKIYVRTITSNIPVIERALARSKDQSPEFLEDLKETAEARCEPIRTTLPFWKHFCQDLLYPEKRVRRPSDDE